MAAVTFVVDIPDADIPRLQAAIRSSAGNPAMTNTEIMEWIRQKLIESLEGVILVEEKKAAVAAAEAPGKPIEIT